jgi:hypothetical protein
MRISKRLLEYRKLEIRKWHKIDKVMDKTTIIAGLLMIVLITFAIWLRGV